MFSVHGEGGPNTYDELKTNNIICKMSMDFPEFTDFTQYLMFAKIGHPKTNVQFVYFQMTEDLMTQPNVF